jgi:hypothetical protein
VSAPQELLTEVVDLGRAVGLLDGDGDLDTSWFDAPLSRTAEVFGDDTQRSALLDLLDGLLGQDPGARPRPGERWYAILPPGGIGNVYLTVDDSAAGRTRVGVAGALHGPRGAAPGAVTADLVIRMPVLDATPTSTDIVVGQPGAPVEIALGVSLHATDIDSLNLSVSLDGAGVSTAVSVVLIEPTGPRTLVLDPTALGSDAVDVVLELLQTRLAEAGIPAALARLPELLGIGTSDPLPFDGDAAAVRSWFARQCSGGAAAPFANSFLDVVSDLLGMSGVTGDGTEATPWQVQGALAAGLQLALSVSLLEAGPAGTPTLRVATTFTGGAGASAAFDASVTLLEVPLSGTGAAQLLPGADVRVRAPADPDAFLVGNATSDPRVRSLRAGMRWDGTALGPMVELLDVSFEGVVHRRIDLLDGTSVVNAASAALQAAIAAAVGSSPTATAMLALAGLGQPPGGSGYPQVNFASFAANPLREIARVHRAVLADTAHPWSGMLTAIATLAGAPAPATVAGAGTAADPWRVALVSVAPLTLDLVAYNAGPGADAQLEIGLRIGVDSAPWHAGVVVDVLSVGLPGAGTAATIGLVDGVHVLASGSPLAQSQLASVSGTTLTVGADAFSLGVDWRAGSPMSGHASVTNVSVRSSDGTSVVVPSMSYSSLSPSGATAGNPLAGFGITQQQAVDLGRMLLARAGFAWGGATGYALLGLLGVHRDLVGLGDATPLVTDAAAVFDHPLDALRDYLRGVTTGLDDDGTAAFDGWSMWLAAVLNGELPPVPGARPPAVDRVVASGSATYDDPWAIPVAGNVELLGWFEPDGPPAAWATAAATKLGAAATAFDVVDAVRRLAGFDAVLSAAMVARDVGATAVALESLRTFLNGSDGVVALASQQPDPAISPGWTLGTEVATAHHLLPGDASVISQVRSQLTSWAPAAVLLVGPPFGSHDDWSGLLAAAGVAPATVPNVDFRAPGVEPEGVDVDALSPVSAWYTADLADDGAADPARVVAQIRRVVERIGALHAGGPVAIVAHSTAGVPARVFVASAAAGSVAGLVTIGSPLRGATFEPVVDPSAADALRFVLTCLDVAGAPLGDAQTQAAVEHLRTALDGFRPGETGTPPVAAAYPVGAFVRTTTDLDLGGVPALAIGSRLSGDIVALLAAALQQVAQNRAAAATTPTHLGVGWRTALGLPATAPDAVQADAWLRVDAGRIRLSSNAAAPEPPRPANAARVQVRLSRPAGWLAGSPTSFTGLGLPMIEARARWAELGLAITPGSGATVELAPYATVADGSVRGVPVTGVLGSPDLAAGLGAVFQAIGAVPPAPGGRLGAVLDALAAIGLVAEDPGGGVGLVTDAVASLLVDTAGYLGPRVRTAMASADGLLGISGSPAGPFTIDLGRNLALTVATDPWQVTLSSGAGGTSLGPLVANLTASLALPAFTPSLSLDVAYGRVAFALSQPAGTLRLTAPPWTDGLDLLPVGSGATQRAVRDELLPRLVLSSAMSALLEQAVGLGGAVGAIDALLAGAGSWLSGSGAFGAGGGGPGLDGAKIGALLSALGRAVTGSPVTGLPLPGGLTLTATGGDPLVLSVATDPSAPLLGVVGLDLAISIDNQRHVTPTGTVTIQVPLGGGGGWSSAAVVLGATPAGVRLAVAPAGLPAIELLPHFSGFGSLADAAAALLPALLDEIDSTLAPPGLIHQAVLDLAAALDLYDAGGGFAAHASAWADVARSGWLDSVAGAVRAAAITAAANVLSRLGLPGSLSASGTSVRWASGALAVQTGWGTGAPELSVSCTDLAVSGTPVHLWLTAAVAAGSGAPAVTVDATVQLDATADVGFAFTPAVRAALDTSGPSPVVDVRLLPLGRAGEATLAVDLVPSFGVAPSTAALGALVSAWLIPIAGAMSLAVADVQTLLDRPIWSGGPTARDVLQRAGVMSGTTLAAPFPALSDLPGLVTRALAESASLPPITLAGGLSVSVVSDGNRFGVRISGEHDIDTGDVTVTLHFGGTETWNGGTDGGITVYLFDLTTSVRFHPGLHVVGLGIGVEGADGALLVSTDNVVLGAVDGYLSFDLDPAAGSPFAFVAAGVELEHVGLPLGLLGGSGQGGSNPVAASLLSGGGATGNGDSQGVNPSVDVAVYYKGGSVKVDFGGTSGPLWIGVHRQFGPIYIDQVGVNVLDGPVVSLLVDGSAHVGPLTVQVDDLELDIPLARLGEPDQWGLDLKGLAVAFNQDPVTIAGGLVKYPGPPVQYNGMLVVSVADLGIAAVGSYARPTDAAGGYTSLFVFAALCYPLGGPPWLFITGLGGGVGYNRELIVPTSVDDVPGFLLVSAIDDNALANDPMSALTQIGPNMPPKRGAFWLAAGLRFTTFQVVKTTAVVYVALDSGVEVGVLGVSRMALPDESFAVVSVELALAARFSSEEMLLSVQAQLTDNSWLFTQDCQLTGGFAFFLWFDDAQFVLTLGGYHPSFQRPDNFPVVPRLGFNLRVDDTIVIKGEAYFALTNTCVMLGGRLEAVFDSGAIRAWFIAYADVLISWDPFMYDVDIGISVGVAATVKICFFGCVRVSISVSVGARLHLAGPPLHGSVGIDYWVLSFTIPFGDTPHDQPTLSWNQFRDKYLVAGDPSGAATSTRVAAGLLPPDPPGAPAAAGTSAQPWKVGAEYTFAVETRLASERWIDFLSGTEHTVASVGDIDIAPMGSGAGNATTVLRLAVTTSSGAAVATAADHWTIVPAVGPVPEATWRYFDQVPAAARNIQAITGASVEGHAVATGRSQLIAIQKLVDDLPQYAHPLPFTPSLGVVLTLVTEWGAGAVQMVAATKFANTPTVLEASAELMAGAATDPGYRVDLGLPAVASLAAVSQVRRRRSAPPLVAPLATGMTLEANSTGPAPSYDHPDDVTPEPLAAPRLRAVLRERPLQSSGTPVAQRTSVRTVDAAVGVIRTAPPSAARTAAGSAVLGGGLHFVAAPGLAAPTRAAAAPRTARSLDLGSAPSVSEQTAFEAAAEDALGAGVPVAAGELHVWDLPGGWAGGRVEVSGDAGTTVRVTCWSRAGGVLLDVERVVGDVPVSVVLPAKVLHVAVTCLGSVPTLSVLVESAALAPQRGDTPHGLPQGGQAVATPGLAGAKQSPRPVAVLAPPGRIAATGWQSGSSVTLVAPHTALCRGGWVTGSTPATARRRRANRPLATARAGDVVRRSRVVETVLPIDTDVVAVLIDLADVAAADGGDLAVAVDGATCSAPVEVAGRRQRMVLYDVTGRASGAEQLRVTVGSGSGWTLAGVVGLSGRASEWSTRFSTSIPDDLVPDGPLTDGGGCVVRFVAAPQPEPEALGGNSNG